MVETIAEIVAKAIKQQIADNYNDPKMQEAYYEARLGFLPHDIPDEYRPDARPIGDGSGEHETLKKPLRNDINPDDAIVIVTEESGKVCVRVGGDTQRNREHFDASIDLDPSMDKFGDECEDAADAAKSTTFRHDDEASDERENRTHIPPNDPYIYLLYKANNWPDMINALNAGLSPKNQIDINILGKGK